MDRKTKSSKQTKQFDAPKSHWLCDIADQIVDTEDRFKKLINIEGDSNHTRVQHSKTMDEHSQTIGMSRNLSVKYPPTKDSKFMSTPKN